MNAPRAPVLEPADEAPARSADERAYLQWVATEPWRFDLWHLLRWFDAKRPDLPALGRGARPSDEPVRIGQEPALAFPPSQVGAYVEREGRPARLEIHGFGLFGPNGPLPIHLTEYARDRLRTHDDATFARFVDILNHRFALLFYRGWADAQSTVGLDRPGEERFSRYPASLVHLGDPSLRARDAVPDHAKLHVAGHLVRETRNGEGLAAILATFFRAAVRIEQWIFDWLPLAPEQRTRLGAGTVGEQLGVGAVTGEKVPDVQSRFRIRLGALALADYESHLPGGRAFEQVLAWLRNYVGYEFAWDVRLVLRREEVPQAALGSATRLGWTTWLGERRRADDADDLVLVHETIAARRACAASIAAVPT